LKKDTNSMSRFFKNSFWAPFFGILLFLCTTSCGIYSFTGASISPEVKTIAIKYFPNHASLVQPSLSQLFTQALRDRFAAQTNLTQVDNAGDLTIEGEITGYGTQPVAIQSNEIAALNRLTITVKVKFTNTKEPVQDFETTFSRYFDYDSHQNLPAVEEDLIKQINEMLVDDIFNKSVVNW